MYIICNKCEEPIHYINIIPTPTKTISVEILSLSGIKLENLWGADIKCKCGHSNTGIILKSKNGISIGQKEYRIER